MKRSAMPLQGTIVAFLLAGGDAAFATSASYECSGKTSLTARFSPPGYPMGQVELTFGDGRTLALPQVVSADGGRYAKGNVAFWIKGNGATLKRGDATQSCQSR